MSDGNQLPPAGETACPTYFAKRLIQQGGAGGFACRSNGHNQWSTSKMNKFPKTVKHPNHHPVKNQQAAKQLCERPSVVLRRSRLITRSSDRRPVVSKF